LFCSCSLDSFVTDRNGAEDAGVRTRSAPPPDDVGFRSVETQTLSVTPWSLQGEDLDIATKKGRSHREEEIIDFLADNTDTTDGIDVVSFMGNQGFTAPDTKGFIARLPRERWSIPHTEEEAPIRGGNVCRFCFVEYCPGDVIARLPCCHQAHERCVEAFLSRCPKCPICWRSVQPTEAVQGYRKPFF